jgi:chemotaxis protein methyltransferase CheR
MAAGQGIDELRMTDAEFRMFAALLRQRCGLHFSNDARFLLEKRIARRLRELDLTSFAAYHYQVRSRSTGDSEFAHLVDELTTNETYFFRERTQLRALVGEIIPEVLVRRRATSGGPVTIWSAGCSSGEEAFSIVMLGIEAGFKPGVDFRVYAADISRKMLQKARQGVYREASFRETEGYFRHKYFTEKDGVFRISDDIKKHVDFIHLNILDRSKIALLAPMDVILCRNVIIYFNAETKKEVIGTLYEKLRPGGHLLLGHAESLISISNAFELRHLREDLVYRRPLPGMEGRDAWNDVAFLAITDVEREGGHR